MGKVEHRTVDRCGVVLANLHYNSNELYKFYLKFSKENNGCKQSFKVKYNPSNIGEIYIYDHIIDKKWIKALCTNQNYANNLSEWEHKEIQKYARNTFGRVNEYELAKAKSIIRQMIENGINYTNAQIARANKVNSQNEIEHRRRNNPMENKQVFIRQDTNSPSVVDLNNLGEKLYENTTNIIPEVLNVNNLHAISESLENVINIDTLDKKKPSKKHSKKSIENTPEDLDLLDFSGFEVTNNYRKE
jgi:hypothetical protein